MMSMIRFLQLLVEDLLVLKLLFRLSHPSLLLGGVLLRSELVMLGPHGEASRHAIQFKAGFG